uniref:Secreted protein n=1 Tax=Cacopsylla melanoneura TaxID=428564 RepID=A0A8D8Z8X0_9HEMI
MVLRNSPTIFLCLGSLVVEASVRYSRQPGFETHPRLSVFYLESRGRGVETHPRLRVFYLKSRGRGFETFPTGIHIVYITLPLKKTLFKLCDIYCGIVHHPVYIEHYRTFNVRGKRD